MSAESSTRPPQGRGFFVRISLFWFGLSFMWGGLGIQILPNRVPELVPPELVGTAIGAIVFFSLLVAIVVQPIAGALSDRSRLRWGRRRPFMVAGVLSAVPFLLFVGVVPSYALLILAVVGLQFTANFAQGPYQGVIPDQVAPEQRGRASGFFGVANLLGTLAGAGVTGAWLSGGHLVPAVVSMVAVLVVTSLVSWVFVPEPEPPEPAPFAGAVSEVRQRLRELSQHSAFGWLMLSRLLFFMGLGTMDNFLVLFIRDGLGASDPEMRATGVMGVVLLFALFTSIPGGRAADRFGKLRVVALAAGLGLLAAALMATASSYGQMLAYAVFLGVGVGLFASADWAAAIDLLPDQRSPGLYMGLSNVATAGGGALATLSAGVALDLSGFGAVWTMMGAFFALSLCVLWIVRSRVSTPTPEAKAPSQRNELVSV